MKPLEILPSSADKNLNDLAWGEPLQQIDSSKAGLKMLIKELQTLAASQGDYAEKPVEDSEFERSFNKFERC